MNLGQLIDPASVWRNADKAAAPSMTERARHARAQGLPGRGIREALRAALADTRPRGRTMELAEIRAICALELSSVEVSTNVASLARAGEVERAGSPGTFRYWLTDKGRAKLAAAA